MPREDARDDLLDLGRIPVRRLVATTSMFLLSRLSQFCQPSEKGSREPAEEGDLAGLDLGVHDLRIRLAERTGVLADDRQVVLAGIAHVAPGVRRDRDPFFVASLKTGSIASPKSGYVTMTSTPFAIAARKSVRACCGFDLALV